MPISEPPPYRERFPFLAAVDGREAKVAAAPVPAGMPGGCCHPAVVMRTGGYPFPTCAKVHKAVAVVRRRKNIPAGPILPVPGAYVSSHPVLTAFGVWTTLVTLPADAAPLGPQYVADILFLGRDGRIVVPSVTVGLH